MVVIIGFGDVICPFTVVDVIFGVVDAVEWNDVLEVDEIVVEIGFFFCGGVGLVPDDVIIVGWVDDPNFVPVD